MLFKWGPEVYPPVHREAAARPPVYQEEGPAHSAPHTGIATSWLYKNIAEGIYFFKPL